MKRLCQTAALLIVALALCPACSAPSGGSSMAASQPPSSSSSQVVPETGSSASEPSSSEAVPGKENPSWCKVPDGYPALPDAPAGPLLAGRAPNLNEYPYEAAVNPDAVIYHLGELTGWNLALSGPPVPKGEGFAVSFAPESSIFTGPPEVQKDEFHVFDAQDLVSSILDSVSASLKSVCGISEVYFTAADGGDLVFENGGYSFHFSADQPYETAG